MSLDAATVKAAARGRWVDVLGELAPALGPALAKLGRHVACPIHGGHDGFRFYRDATETGGAVCNTCGPLADGFAVLQWVNGCDFPTALRAVAAAVGVASPNGQPADRRPEPTDAERRERVERIWCETTTGTKLLRAYLRGRGLSGNVPPGLRLHRGLDYYEEGKKLGRFPAMVGEVSATDGERVGVHVTYLKPDGSGKAPVPTPKKIFAVADGATRGAGIYLLGPPGTALDSITITPVMAAAEGVETALAVMEATATLTIAAGSAGALKALVVPAAVDVLEFWADHDATGVGAAAAEAAAAHHHAAGRAVKVLVPLAPGDWLDVFMKDGPAALKQARGEARRWRPPSTSRSSSTTRSTSSSSAPPTPWDAAVSAPDFLAVEDQEVDYLEARLLVRGHITALFSPRGLGKTHTALAVAVKLAHAGLRVLLLDRDNAPREVRRRLRRWGALDCPTLKVLTRRNAPALSDAAAWAQFPTTSYDVVMVDSIDATTEGVGESDSARPSQALARLLDIVRQEDGPAGLLLGNTIKSAAHSRGSGVVEDRLDVAYEVRDATGLEPTGTKDWWFELPPAGAEAWGDRASRRKQRDRYRLAFVPSKFRMDQEPEPFVLELDLSGERWTLTDVTADVVQAGEAARAAAAAGAHAKAETATTALKAEIVRREQAGEAPMRTDRDAVPFLMADGLTRKAARQLLLDRDGADWGIEELTRERGRPKILHSVQTLETGGSGGNGGVNNPPSESCTQRGDSESDSRRPLPARPAEIPFTNPAPSAVSESPIISAADRAPTRPPAAGTPAVEADEVDEETARRAHEALRKRAQL